MKQAVILAAGEGRRLKPFTVNKPKVMLSIAGKPILHYVIESLIANGIRDIVIVVGYQKEKVYDYVGDGKQYGANITFVTQNKQLGTAQALYMAKEALEDEFLVLNGNRLISPDTISRFVRESPPAILIKKVDDASRYGVVRFNNGLLSRIIEKPDLIESDFVSTGIYAFPKYISRYIEGELKIPDAVNKMLSDGVLINAFETEGTWLDVVYPWDIINLNAIILRTLPFSQSGNIETGVQLKGKVNIGQDTVIRSNSYIVGPVTIGKGCEIGPNVCIFPSTSVGDNVVISPFTELRNCVIGDDVRVASGSSLEDSVIDSGCNIGANFVVRSEDAEVKVDEEHYVVKTGAMVGSSCQIGNLVTIRAGTIIGNNTQINSLKLVSGNIPERSMVV